MVDSKAAFNFIVNFNTTFTMTQNNFFSNPQLWQVSIFSLRHSAWTHMQLVKTNKMITKEERTWRLNT